YSLPPAAIARSLAALAAGPVLDSGEGPEATPGSEEERATAPQREAEAELETGAFDAIADLLQNATGVRFRDYKRATISRRVRRRLQELGLQDFPTYLARLREDPAEIRTLFETVLIHFTGFFREPPTFDALRETVLPAVLANRPAGAPVRAWVVACSTGQEAYSAAISLGEGLAALGRDVPLQIFATDLSESALAVARTGRYPESIAGEVSPERLSRFFVPVDGGHRVKDQVREMCVFARHDVTRDPPFSHQDLVLCRNLLIYLNPDLQRRVLHNLHYALKPTGFLALGSSERAGRVDELFEPVDRSHRIYARRPAPTHVFMDLARASGRQSRPLPEPAGAPLPPVAPSETEIQRIAEHTLFTSYPGASVIVGPDLGIVHVQGQARPYLEVPTGGPTAQLLRMAHPDLRSALGRLLRKARKDQAPARRANLPIETGGRVGHVNLTVLPLPAGAGSPGHCLVVFDPVRVRGRAGTTEEAETSAGAGDQAGGDTGLADVRQELAETKEYLESVIGQQASTHAELEEAYQSLLSSNEEFQSTNEELETTKEELQSLNEELTTLNEELHQRNAELTARAAEIAGLLESMTMPVVMLTADLRVRAFNAPAAAELRLGPASLGRRLQQAQLPVVFPLLLELAERALRDGTQQEREVQSSQGKWHALRTWPILGPAGDAPSVVFALVDITSLKTRLALTEEARAYSSAIVETVVEPLVVLDQELRMLTANRAFHRAFGASPEAIRGISLFQLGSGEWDRPELRKLLDEVRLTGTAFEGYETTLQSEGNARVFWLNARLISEPGSDLKNVLLALEDITQRKLLEGRLAETARMRALGQLAGGVAHEINNQMTAVLGFAGFLLRSPGVGEAQRSELQLIIKAAQRSADITRQLLAFSRRETLRPIVLDLNAIVAASETLLHRALGPDIELDISLGPLVGQVRVDQAGLEQALVNLAINARDAMPGGGRLTV
ncbi:MAG: CheR family methyltransferase, partial [Gemmatimonadales bacterium]